MGYMDQALRDHQLPTSEDLEIQLPTRREPRKEAPAPEPGEPGQHGGGADGTPAGEAHADATASGASGDAAPAPQRDEPDEGEHTDSTEEQIAARAARDVVAPVEETPAASDVVDQAPAEQGPTEEPAPEPEKHHTLAELLATSEGSSPRTFKRSGFSAGKGVNGIQMKKFPQPVLDKLRLSLAETAGGQFAEALSATSILTAFVMANTGLELDVDEDTATAVEAFRENDPRMVDVEDKLDMALENINQLGRAMNIGLRRIGETGHLVDELEFGMAFLVADRVVRLATPETDETNVDIVQKKSLVVRDRLKAQTKTQRTIEKQREERSNA